MSKKSKKEKQEESADLESAELQALGSETAPAENEAERSASESQGGVDSTSQASASSEEVSMDDLLDDVRRSLIEDDTQTEDKKAGWWDRLSKGHHKEHETQAPDEKSAHSLEVSTPSSHDTEYIEQIDELNEMLDNDELESEPVIAALQPEPESILEPLPEPEPVVNLDELKKRVFQSRPEEAQENLTEVRSIALEGGEEVFVEVEAAKVDQRQENIKAFENAFRPYRRYIYFATAFLGLVMAVAVIVLMVRTLAADGRLAFLQPPATPTFNPNLPYPAAIELPGGVAFNLAKGSTLDGKWNPKGPEWLIGTEICRWVAIPWSLQVEAVVRTFNQQNTIDLVMSNGDRVSYTVSSIQELTVEEMQALDQNSPCLLVVLAKEDSEKRWVVTAKP